jgi:uncharacterized protein
MIRSCQASHVSLAAEAAGSLFAAGVVAGIIGSGGGVTSLVSYPALLAVGIPPLPANIANLVAGVAIGPGSAPSSRRELVETRTVLVRLPPITILGTVAGAGLLLVTPPGVFARVVPFLVAAGAMILIIQPALIKLPEGWVRRTPLLQRGLVGAVCVYGGYFGAGSGVMLLAVILVLVDSRIAPANAIKNVLLRVTSLVAAAVFIATGPVLWAAVLPPAGGLFIGSALGPIIVRHLPPNLVRWMAATFGFILAIYLWVRPP